MAPLYFHMNPPLPPNIQNSQNQKYIDCSKITTQIEYEIEAQNLQIVLCMTI